MRIYCSEKLFYCYPFDGKIPTFSVFYFHLLFAEHIRCLFVTSMCLFHYCVLLHSHIFMALDNCTKFVVLKLINRLKFILCCVCVCALILFSIWLILTASTAIYPFEALLFLPPLQTLQYVRCVECSAVHMSHSE